MSRDVLLRPLLPSDFEWCYALMCGPSGARWRYRGRTPSPEVVSADLWRNVFAQFVVVDRELGTPMGLVGLYNVSLDAGRAHAFAVADPDRSTRVVEGFGILCAWAFEQHGFERIFLEAPEFNAVTFASLGDAAVVEGRLRNYEFWRGRYWDLLIMSISRAAFDRRFSRLLDRRTGPVVTGTGDVAAIEMLVAALWPLDSLATVEVMCAVEEVVGRAVPDSLLRQLDAATPEQFAAQLLARALSVGTEDGATADQPQF